MMNVIERAHAHGVHIEALTRYAGGYDAVPQPSPEVAAAIVRGYCLLLHENEQLRAALVEMETGAPIRMLDSMPGFERWRRQVLDDPSRRPLERIAALEVTAAQCKSEGDDDGYAEMMAEARAILQHVTERGRAA
jgi:hypothetical protein